MGDINKKTTKKWCSILEYVFWIALGIMITTYISVGRAYGSVIGVIVHLFFKISITSLLMFLTKKPFLSFAAYNSTEFLFGMINFLKVNMRSQPLEPWDFSFFGDLGVITAFLDMSFLDFLQICFSLVFFVAITITDLYAFEKCCEIPNKKGKVIITSIVIPMLFLLCTCYMRVNVKFIEANRNGFSNYTRLGRTNEYGAMVNFFLDLGMIGWEKIDLPYSEEKVKEIYDKNLTDIVGAEEYDNVIFLLLESYYDMNELGILSFEKNPLENYYKYAKEDNREKLCVNNIGGGTSNVEFQILTMHGLEQYNEGIYPYVHLIKDEIQTLPRIFKDNDYETTAIHNYEGSFYNRENVYPLMGIDTFIDAEDFGNLENLEQTPEGFIADIEIYNKIVQILENQEKSFITVTTMGGHPPYGGFMFDEYTEWYEDESWNENLTLAINNYVQKLRNSDNVLGELIEYIENSDEKTLLIAYGDHFPLIYTMLEKKGLIEENERNLTKEKYPELFELPYVVYSNVQDDIKLKEKIIPSEMGMYILENVKLQNIGPLYNAIYSYFAGNESFENYQLIQYDNIQGEQYWKNYADK